MKKKKQELPNNGLHPILPDWQRSADFFNQANTPNANVPSQFTDGGGSIGDACGESFSLKESDDDITVEMDSSPEDFDEEEEFSDDDYDYALRECEFFIYRCLEDLVRKYGWGTPSEYSIKEYIEEADELYQWVSDCAYEWLVGDYLRGYGCQFDGVKEGLSEIEQGTGWKDPITGDEWHSIFDYLTACARGDVHGNPKGDEYKELLRKTDFILMRDDPTPITFNFNKLNYRGGYCEEIWGGLEDSGWIFIYNLDMQECFNRDWMDDNMDLILDILDNNPEWGIRKSYDDNESDKVVYLYFANNDFGQNDWAIPPKALDKE